MTLGLCILSDTVRLKFETNSCNFILFLCTSVKRKGELLSEIVEVSDGINLTEEDEIEEKQPVLTNVPLLANEEFEKETGGYQSEPEEDEDNQSEDELHVEISPVSKKRKASKKLQSSKYVLKPVFAPYSCDVHNNCNSVDHTRMATLILHQSVVFCRGSNST